MTRRPPDPASPEGEREATPRPENHAATAAHGFAVIGLKERSRNRAPTLTFQGLRPVSEHNATILMQRLGALAGASV